MTLKSISLMAITMVVPMSTIGCQPQPMTPQAKAEMVKKFNELLAKQRRIEFLSWNGKWIGRHCDTDIVFLPGEAVEVTEHADAISRNKGSYRLENDGVLTLLLPGMEGRWPTLVLQKDARSFLIRPKDPEVESNSEGRRGKGYWPFRVSR